jgi:hypothetical protein
MSSTSTSASGYEMKWLPSLRLGRCYLLANRHIAVVLALCILCCNYPSLLKNIATFVFPNRDLACGIFYHLQYILSYFTVSCGIATPLSHYIISRRLEFRSTCCDDMAAD